MVRRDDGWYRKSRADFCQVMLRESCPFPIRSPLPGLQANLWPLYINSIPLLWIAGIKISR